MSELLIIIFALVVVGKIHSREAVVTEVILLRPAGLQRRPASYREQERTQTPSPTSRLYTNAYRPANSNYEHSQSTRGSDNFNLTPSTVKQIEPHLFISTKISDKMERPLDVTGNKSSKQNSSASDKDVNTVTSPNDSVNFVVPPNRSISSDSKSNNTDKMPSVVDLDERSSFSGDPCPVGYVRFNGECVKTD